MDLILEDLLKKFKAFSATFCQNQVLTVSHTDKASIQCGEFLKNDIKLVNKDDDIDRLDDFFFTKLDVGKKYPEQSKVIIIILILSHVQTDNERGFSQNKTVLQQKNQGGFHF